MADPTIQIYKQGFQILHSNLYLFWVNLAYTLPFDYILSETHINSWILILIPFIIITLKLTDTQLLFDQPQKPLKIMETFVVVLYKYFLRVFFLCTAATIIGLVIFELNGGSLQTLIGYAQTFTSPQETLLQKLTFALPVIILSPIVPFFKIFWVVKKQTFIKSMISACLYAYKHILFALIPPIITILLIVIQHPITGYLDKINNPILTVINIYLGLVMTSASIAHFKSHKQDR